MGSSSKNQPIVIEVCTLHTRSQKAQPQHDPVHNSGNRELDQIIASVKKDFQYSKSKEIVLQGED
jgi:hypothetical protein